MHRLTHVAHAAHSQAERDGVALQHDSFAAERAVYTTFAPVVVWDLDTDDGGARVTPASLPPSTDLCCYHDGEPFDTVPVYAPISVRRAPLLIRIGGPPYCSFACAKRALMERHGADAFQLIEALHHVARHAYGAGALCGAAIDPHADDLDALRRAMSARFVFRIVPAPPRAALKKYNARGMTIDEFRARSRLDPHLVMNVLAPPCVAYGRQCLETVDVRKRKAAAAEPAAEPPPCPAHAAFDMGPSVRRAVTVQRRPATSLFGVAAAPPMPALYELNGAAGAAALGYRSSAAAQRAMGLIAAAPHGGMPPPPPPSARQMARVSSSSSVRRRSTVGVAAAATAVKG